MKACSTPMLARIAIIATAALMSLAALSATAGASQTERAKHTAARYGGTPPMWVEHPYLAEVGDGRLAVKAQAYVDPFRRPSAKHASDQHLRATPDRLVFSVVIAKPKYANPGRPPSVRLLPESKILARGSQTVIAKDRGLVSVAVVLDRKASKQLRALSFLRQRAAISVLISHQKDTFGASRLFPGWGLTQTNDASLQPRAASLDERTHYLRIARQQILADRGVGRKPRQSGDRSTRSTQASPMYNYVYLTNSTPFQQQIAFNPNIQCMWTGSSVQFPGAQTAQVPSGGLLQMAYVMEPNPYYGNLGTLWTGLNGATTGMNAPGTAVTGVQALANAATTTGLGVLTGEPEINIGEIQEGGPAGALVALGVISAKFMTTLIDSPAVNGTCSTNASDFPETFGVTTTVTGFGTNGQSSAWGVTNPNNNIYTPTNYTTPNYWNLILPVPQPPNSTFVDTAGTAAPIDGLLPGGCNANAGSNACYFPYPAKVGTQLGTNQNSSCPAPSANTAPSTWCTFVYNNLQPMLGAQTSATYYWNGGAPSYMVSNNAPAGSYIGGAASFSGGLFQNIGPSPGQPGNAWCWGKGLTGVINCSYMNATDAPYMQNYNPMGAMNIALTYLTTPQYQAGLYTGLAAGQSGTPGPQVQVSQGTNQNGEAGLNVTCNLAGIQPFLSLPFAAGGGTTSANGPSLLATSVNAAGEKPTGTWNVTFFGIDSNGNALYYNPIPGVNPSSNSTIQASQYSLGPNLTSTSTSTFNIAQNAMPSGFLPYADLSNLQTVQNMNSGSSQTSTLAGIGCSASPVLSVAGLDITGDIASAASVFGQILPILGTSPTPQSSGWPMPGAGTTSWPNNIYAKSPWNTWTQYAWQTPVEQVNVSWQGVPTSSTIGVKCTQAAGAATPTCTTNTTTTS